MFCTLFKCNVQKNTVTLKLKIIVNLQLFSVRGLQKLLYNKKQQQQQQLEVHGRARREAARRGKSEWKVNLSNRNSSRSNGSWRMTT